MFDEAHKLASHLFGNMLEKTGRFKLAEKLGARTRHILLMTATSHNGKEEDLQLFLFLLDSDRFYGKFHDGVHKVDCSDLIRRIVKKKLIKFDARYGFEAFADDALKMSLPVRTPSRRYEVGHENN